MKKIFTGALAVMTFALIGCGADGSESGATAEAAGSDATSQTIATGATSGKFDIKPGVSKMGEAVTNGGAKISLNSVTSTPTISFRSGMIRGQFEPKDARTDGVFVVVDATVENVGSTSMDLTCGYPIATMLVDDEKRQFDAIRDLHRVEGNPECNVGLQPGFSSEMKWIYEVPSSAVPMLFAFYPTDTGSISNLGAIATGPVLPA